MKNRTDVINILCATDENYAPYCGIMLTSLFESNRRHPFNVYLTVDGTLSSCNKRKFHFLAEKYGCKIMIKKVDDRLLSGFSLNQTSHLITLPTYYRLLATKILPSSVSKVIYFDCDVIVMGDIEPLWRTEMLGKSVAAVMDCGLNFNESGYTRLGFSSQWGYFNAGMLVINLDYWRDNDSYQLAVTYATQNASKLAFMDQDILNALFFNSKVTLPERFNFQTDFFFIDLWDNYSEDCRAKLLEESKKAVVVHYCGGVKPWHFKYHEGAFHSIWNYYRKNSLWKRCRNFKPVWKYIKYTVKKLFFPRMLAQQMNERWVVLPCNEACYL